MDAFVQRNPNGWADYGYEYTRLPVENINEGLSVLGVTIEDIQIPEQWVHNPNLDCYYFWVTDAYGVGKWSVTKVEKGTEGIVAVYWETESIQHETEGILRDVKMVLTMQQQPDGTYRILSNVPQKCATTEAKPKPHVLHAWTGEFSEENFRKTIESYQQNCTPFIFDEKNTTSSVTFETGFSISEAKIFRLTLVDDSNIAIEAEGWGRLVIYIEFEHNDTEISVDIADWWHRFHENEEVNKVYIWSYIICAKDTAGAEHYFYFRVQYPTLQNDAES